LSQPKKKPNPEDELLDLPVDREQGLANGFDDLSLTDVLPMDGQSRADSVSEASTIGVAQEAVEALEELVFDLGKESGESKLEPDNILSLNDVGEILEPTPQEESLDPISLVNTSDAFESNGEKDFDEAFSVAGETPSTVHATQLMGEKLFAYVVCEVPFEQMVEELLVILMKALNAQAGSILELDYDKQEFFFRATLGGGDPALIKTFRIPADKGIVGHVAESKQTLLLKDLDSDEKQLRAISMSTGFETRTCLAAPILIGNQLYGVIELFNRLPDGSFDEEDKEVLERGLKMVAKVLEVRFLLSELFRRAG